MANTNLGQCQATPMVCKEAAVETCEHCGKHFCFMHIDTPTFHEPEQVAVENEGESLADA
jgi:hypothetical protein